MRDHPRQSLILLALIALLGGTTAVVRAQAAVQAEGVSGLRRRRSGPARMGGRVADIAVGPRDPSTW